MRTFRKRNLGLQRLGKNKQLFKGGAVKVLVADDSGVMRKIITSKLNSLGVVDVVGAVDGDDAISKFAEQPFDLVMTDWNMPGKSGLDVVTAIRATGSDVPVIMVTTESEQPKVIAAIQAGVTDYLAKPFGSEDLKAKIEPFVSC